MRTFQNILIATDLSEASEAALALGARLVQTFGSRVTLVTAFDPTPYIPGVDVEGAPYWTRLVESTEERFRERLEAVRAEFLAGTGCNLALVREPSAAHAILNVAAEIHADLVVVGSHGRTGIKRAFLGSVAEKVVRHAKCPVLVAR